MTTDRTNTERQRRFRERRAEDTLLAAEYRRLKETGATVSNGHDADAARIKELERLLAVSNARIAELEDALAKAKPKPKPKPKAETKPRRVLKRIDPYEGHVRQALDWLGLLPYADLTADEVNVAFRTAAKSHHPDAANGSTKSMQDLNKARERALWWVEYLRWKKSPESKHLGSKPPTFPK